ncbi:hypothetical protein NL676_037394 [Syzygium grande]|nr:hypothetical protein NL676_037394 [Syzygium grande]
MAAERFALDGGGGSGGRSYRGKSYSRLCLEGGNHALDKISGEDTCQDGHQFFCTPALLMPVWIFHALLKFWSLYNVSQ